MGEKEDSGNLPAPGDKQAAVAGVSRWGGEKVQKLEKGECSGLVRDKRQDVKSAGRKRIGTFAGGKVQPLEFIRILITISNQRAFSPREVA